MLFYSHRTVLVYLFKPSLQVMARLRMKFLARQNTFPVPTFPTFSYDHNHDRHDPSRLPRLDHKFKTFLFHILILLLVYFISSNPADPQ